MHGRDSTGCSIFQRWRWLVLACVLVAAPRVYTIGLDLEQVELSENAVIQFSETYCREITMTDELNAAKQNWRCTDTPSFRVCADPSRIEPSRWTGFSYVVYVQPRDRPSDEGLCECRLSAIPIGSFFDQEGDVDFRVTLGDMEEAGSLRVPLHSRQSEHFLHFDLEETPVRFRIGQPRTLTIRLHNKLANLEVIVEDRLEVALSDRSVWTEDGVTLGLVPTPRPGADYQLAAGSGPTRAISVTANPSRWSSLSAAFFPYRQKKGSPNAGAAAGKPTVGVHDRFVVYVPYRTAGGAQRILEVDVPVRFQPSPWLLILVVVLGALLGRVLSLLQRRVRLSTWLRRAGVGVLFALLGWLVGLLLVEADSELKLFGLVFDPYQLIPAFLLGTVLGLSRPRFIRLLEDLAGGDER